MANSRPSAERYPGVEFRDIRGHTLPGYLNIKQLVAALRTTRSSLALYDIGPPDFFTHKAIYFAEGRLPEIREKWKNRSKPSPVWEPVKGVITRFGMMLPRERPDESLLERLIQSRPKRPSRDSSWKTRPRYNLRDLTP